MELLHMLSGPLIGAVIGYFTNYLAVKMLFHPYNPVKIGRWTLPFTPGIIPKRRGHLAKALGRVVGNELLTGDDVKKLLLSEEMETKVSEYSVAALKTPGYESLHEICSHFTGEENYEEKKSALCHAVSRKICEELENMGISDLIVREGTRMLKEKWHLNGWLIDSGIASVAKSVAASVDTYIREHGEEVILPVLEKNAAYYADTPFAQLLEEWQVQEEQVGRAAALVYRRAIESQTERAVRALDIAGIVEEKINSMSTPDLEKLLLSVMKKELSALVSLGAVIGFVIGIINSFI